MPLKMCQSSARLIGGIQFTVSKHITGMRFGRMIRVDNRCEVHGGARTDVEVQIGVAQQIKHHQPDEQDDQNADENGKEARRQRQVMEWAQLHWRCSKILANTVARTARERPGRQALALPHLIEMAAPYCRFVSAAPSPARGCT